MKHLKLFEAFKKLPELTMENVDKVPEGKHVITKEDNDKIKTWLIEQEEEDNTADYVGKTLKDAADKIGPKDFEKETLQHLIVLIFPGKYEPTY